MKARLPQGYGKSSQGNINNMIKQAQIAQEKMKEKQAEINEREFSATAGGGAVEVTAGGDKVLHKVTLKPEIVDPDDIEMLEDLIVAAVNELLRNIDDVTNNELEEIANGFDLPGVV